MAKPKTEEPWEHVGEKLDLVARLLAYLVAAQHDNLEQRAVALSVLGLSASEIARVCNTTPNTISVRLVEAKKKTSRRRSGKTRRSRKKG